MVNILSRLELHWTQYKVSKHHTQTDETNITNKQNEVLNIPTSVRQDI